MMKKSRKNTHRYDENSREIFEAGKKPVCVHIIGASVSGEAIKY